jgi:hypothetical protein
VLWTTLPVNVQKVAPYEKIETWDCVITLSLLKIIIVSLEVIQL